MGYKHQVGTQPIPYQHDPEIAHDVKSWVGFFEEINLGEAEYDDRVMDRDYQVGDIVRLHEFDPVIRKFTGRECDVEITKIENPVGDMHPAIARLYIQLCG